MWALGVFFGIVAILFVNIKISGAWSFRICMAKCKSSNQINLKQRHFLYRKHSDVFDIHTHTQINEFIKMRAWKAFLCHRLIVVSFIPDRRIFVLLCLFILDNMTAIIEKTNTFIRHFILCAAEKALWIVFIYCHIALHLICWGFLFVMVVVSCCLSLMPLKKAYERIWNANVYIYSSINAFLLYLFLSVLCHSPFLVWENANHTLLPWCTQSFSIAYAFISRLETRFSATFPVYFHHLHNGHAFRNAYGCRSHHTHTHSYTQRYKGNAFMSVTLPHFLLSLS